MNTYENAPATKMSFQELKEAYLGYFRQVGVEKVGGRGRIRDFSACMALVKERKLVRTKAGFRLA